MFIIDDERDDVMTKAFFHHNQSTDAAVIVIKGMDLLKAHMELQDILQPHDRQLFISFQQLEHLRVNRKGTGAGLLLLAAVHTRLHFFSALCIGAIVQFFMQPHNQLGSKFG